jgi:hypothetical protein
LWRFINLGVDFMSFFSFNHSLLFDFDLISDINFFCKSRKIYSKDDYPWRQNWQRNWQLSPFNVSNSPLTLNANIWVRFHLVCNEKKKNWTV